MTDITIPERFLPGFTLIGSLENSDLDILIDVFAKMPIGEKPKFDFTEHKTLSLSGKDLNLLISTVLSVVTLWLTRKEEQNNLVNLLVDTYFSQVKDEGNPPDDAFKESLTKNLNVLLGNSKALRIHYKAADLVRDHDKMYQTSRVLTDVRYVFNYENLDFDQKFAVIIHNLKIGYESDGEDKATYITMTSSELEDLKKAIERALEKEQKLKEIHLDDKMIFIDF